MGEFGVKPSQYVSTYNDPRFVGLTLDALNLEMSKISAMNKDFSNSIMPHCREYNKDGVLSYLQTNVNIIIIIIIMLALSFVLRTSAKLRA